MIIILKNFQWLRQALAEKPTWTGIFIPEDGKKSNCQNDWLRKRRQFPR